MADTYNRQYWQKREQQERNSADRAVGESARQAHREMAARYSQMADEGDAPESNLPRRG